MLSLNPKRFLSIGFILSLLICSCQKEISSVNTPNPPPSPPPVNDSILIKMYVRLDTLHASAMDTTDKITFSYDNLKRLSQTNIYYYDTVTGGLDESYRYTFSYASSDTLPVSYQIHQVDNNGGASLNPDINVSVFYNAQGQPTQQRRIYAPNGYHYDSAVSLYTYSGNTTTILTTTYINGSLSKDSTHNTAQLVNGNVAGDVYSHNLFSGGPSGVNTYQNTFTSSFDNKKNPFLKNAFLFKLMNTPEKEIAFFGGFDFSVNNVTSINDAYFYNSYPTPTNLIDTYTAVYKYNSLGLPATAIYTATEYGAWRRYAGKKLFFYTN